MAPMRRERGLIHLAAFMRKHDISVMSLARAIGCHVFSLNSAIRRGRMPMEHWTAIDLVFERLGVPVPKKLWVNSEGIDTTKRKKPIRALDDGRVISVHGAHPLARERALTRSYVSPAQLNSKKEKDMQPLTLTARRRYGFEFDPFRAEMQSVDDVLLTPEHEAALAEMLRAAKRQDFIAVIGDIGCGKSTVSEVFYQKLPSNIYVVKAHSLNKKEITGNNLYDAILLDIAGELDGTKLTIPTKREHKARKVIRLLEELERADKSAVLVLDECHDLSLDCLRALKRLHELDRAFKRLLGIILTGQLQFNKQLNDPTIHEVSARIARFEFKGLGKKAPEYCRHKIAAAYKGSIDNIIEPEALAILQERCTRTFVNPSGKRLKYGPYPLQLNGMLTLAFNHADDLGHAKVTAEDMADITPPKETR